MKKGNENEEHKKKEEEKDVAVMEQIMNIVVSLTCGESNGYLWLNLNLRTNFSPAYNVFSAPSICTDQLNEPKTHTCI